jgi:hypothetical protein
VSCSNINGYLRNYQDCLTLVAFHRTGLNVEEEEEEEEQQQQQQKLSLELLAAKKSYLS